jgi:cytoskeletal protein CcmA (bactofilin family)
VECKVEGPISLGERRLTVGQNAHVTGEITASEVIVFGDVKGSLLANDRIEIKKHGSVVGDLTTSRIMIEDGAYYKGSIEIARKS